MKPAKRLGSEAEGKAWLDAVAQIYAQRVGITLSTPYLCLSYVVLQKYRRRFRLKYLVIIDYNIEAHIII
jgi:hypothetical protein